MSFPNRARQDSITTELFSRTTSMSSIMIIILPSYRRSLLYVSIRIRIRVIIQTYPHTGLRGAGFCRQTILIHQEYAYPAVSSQVVVSLCCCTFEFHHVFNDILPGRIHRGIDARSATFSRSGRLGECNFRNFRSAGSNSDGSSANASPDSCPWTLRSS